MKKATIAAILIIVILAGSAFGVIAYASDWFKLPVNRWGGRLGIDSDKQPEEDNDDGVNPPGIIDGDGNVMNPDEINVMPMAMTFVGETENNTIQIKATPIPEDTRYDIAGNSFWSVSWANPDSEWASGKSTGDYVSVIGQNSNIATVECKQAFGEQIIITYTLRGTNLKKTCTVDYEKKVTGIETVTLNYNDGLEYELFGKHVEFIRANMNEVKDEWVESPVENPIMCKYGIGTVESENSIKSVLIIMSKELAEAAEGYLADDFYLIENLYMRDVTAVYTDETYGLPGSFTWLMSLMFGENAIETDVYTQIRDMDFYTSAAMLEDDFYENSIDNECFDFNIMVTMEDGNIYNSGFFYTPTDTPTDITLSPDSIIFK